MPIFYIFLECDLFNHGIACHVRIRGRERINQRGQPLAYIPKDTLKFIPELSLKHLATLHSTSWLSFLFIFLMTSCCVSFPILFSIVFRSSVLATHALHIHTQSCFPGLTLLTTTTSPAIPTLLMPTSASSNCTPHVLLPGKHEEYHTDWFWLVVIQQLCNWYLITWARN